MVSLRSDGLWRGTQHRCVTNGMQPPRFGLAVWHQSCPNSACPPADIYVVFLRDPLFAESRTLIDSLIPELALHRAEGIDFTGPQCGTWQMPIVPARCWPRDCVPIKQDRVEEAGRVFVAQWLPNPRGLRQSQDPMKQWTHRHGGAAFAVVRPADCERRREVRRSATMVGLGLIDACALQPCAREVAHLAMLRLDPAQAGAQTTSSGAVSTRWYLPIASTSTPSQRAT